jgi:hypothetical protein
VARAERSSGDKRMGAAVLTPPRIGYSADICQVIYDALH